MSGKILGLELMPKVLSILEAEEKTTAALPQHLIFMKNKKGNGNAFVFLTNHLVLS